MSVVSWQLGVVVDDRVRIRCGGVGSQGREYPGRHCTPRNLDILEGGRALGFARKRRGDQSRNLVGFSVFMSPPDTGLSSLLYAREPRCPRCGLRCRQAVRQLDHQPWRRRAYNESRVALEALWLCSTSYEPAQPSSGRACRGQYIYLSRLHCGIPQCSFPQSLDG